MLIIQMVNITILSRMAVSLGLYLRNVLFLYWFITWCVVIDGERIEVKQAGFMLRRFENAKTVSLQCSCQYLPKDSRKILSINLKLHLSTSQFLPVASLYADGK